jgi:hypothetical protein
MLQTIIRSYILKLSFIRDKQKKTKKKKKVTFTKNFKILKIAGSRAEFLDFDFEIQNFF